MQHISISSIIGHNLHLVTKQNEKKLAVVTDEGVISLFNWNQFGNLSDRFPIVVAPSKGGAQPESMVKLNENVVALGTNSGAIKSASLLPNLVLSDIGTHAFTGSSSSFCGDCMAIAVNHDQSIVASGCPESNFLCFFSSSVAFDESLLERADRMSNKRKRARTVVAERKKRRVTDNDGFLDGLYEEDEDEEEDDGEEDDGEEDVESIDGASDDDE